MNHRWWHRFFLRVIQRESEEFNNLEGWRLKPNQFFVECKKCNWIYIGTSNRE